MAYCSVFSKMVVAMNKYLITLFLIFPSLANADLTGAGDAALFTELKLITANTLESVKQAREAIDVQERMKEIEELKQLKKLTDEGKALSASVSNIRQTVDEIDRFQDDPLGIEQTKREIEHIQMLHDKAESEGALDKAATYGRLLQDLGRLSMLQEANRKNLSKQGEGTNEDDDIKTSAQSTLIMSDIMVEAEKRKTIKDAQEATAIQDLFNGTNYGAMGKGE